MNLTVAHFHFVWAPSWPFQICGGSVVFQVLQVLGESPGLLAYIFPTFHISIMFSIHFLIPIQSQLSQSSLYLMSSLFPLCPINSQYCLFSKFSLSFIFLFPLHCYIIYFPFIQLGLFHPSVPVDSLLQLTQASSSSHSWLSRWPQIVGTQLPAGGQLIASSQLVVASLSYFIPQCSRFFAAAHSSFELQQQLFSKQS